MMKLFYIAVSSFRARPCVMMAIALTAPGRLAHAQTGVEDPALAEGLFQHGRELMADGHLPEACAKFAESQRIEPKLGTLLNLATCHERQGRVATAWAEYTQAATQARYAHQPEREAFASRHLTALEAKLSRLIITWDAPSAGEAISLDGVTLGSSTLGTKLPVDPGEHTVEAVAPGKQTWHASVRIEDGPQEQPVRIPKLLDAAARTAPAVESTPPAVAVSPTAPPPSSATAGPNRTAAWITSGVGVAALAAGTYFGLHAFALKRDAQNACNGDACSQRGLELFDDVDRNATASTIAFSIALVSGGLGGFLAVRDDRSASSRSSTVVAGQHAAYAAVLGSW